MTRARTLLAVALTALAFGGYALAHGNLVSGGSTGPNSPAAGWTSDGTTTSTTQAVSVTNGPENVGAGGFATDGGLRLHAPSGVAGVVLTSDGGVLVVDRGAAVGWLGISTDGGITIEGANPIALKLGGANNAGPSYSTVTANVCIGNISAGTGLCHNMGTGIQSASTSFTSPSVSATAASGSIGFQLNTGAKGCKVTGGTACDSSILGVGLPQTDQSADCDNAATGNAPTGKVCVGAGQGSMVLTNSSIFTTSLVMLTNISDDATCLSGYVTVAAGSATIGCVGAATATANTVFAFAVFNP